VNLKILTCLQISIKTLVVVILLIGASSCFVTYAVIPEKYELPQYSQEQVQAIAYRERRAGIGIAYETNEYQLKYTYIPLFILLIINAALGCILKRLSSKK
jgi:uncharacterized membrane protein